MPKKKKHRAWISNRITWSFNSQPLAAVARGDHAEIHSDKDYCVSDPLVPSLLVSLCACAFVHRLLSNKCLVSWLDGEHDAWMHIIWAAERLPQCHQMVYKPATFPTICTLHDREELALHIFWETIATDVNLRLFFVILEPQRLVVVGVRFLGKNPSIHFHALLHSGSQGFCWSTSGSRYTAENFGNFLYLRNRRLWNTGFGPNTASLERVLEDIWEHLESFGTH